MIRRATQVRCPVCRSAVPAMVLWAVGDACPRCHRALHLATRRPSSTGVLGKPLALRESRSPADNGRSSQNRWSAGRGNSDAQARHEQAVAQTLEWADEAAARGDQAEALAWLKTVEAAGHQLSSDYQRKRERWRLVLRAGSS